MDKLHKPFRHIKRLKIVLRKPLKRTKHASEQNNAVLSVKCQHCKVQTLDVETQVSPTFHTEQSSPLFHVEKSDVETQASVKSLLVDACVQVNITPTRIPRLIGGRQSFNCETSVQQTVHTACQTEEAPKTRKSLLQNTSVTPRSILSEISNVDVQEEFMELKLEEKFRPSEKSRVHSGSNLGVRCGDARRKLNVSISSSGTEGDLNQSQNVNGYEDLKYKDVPRSHRCSSIGIQTRMKNFSFSSPSGIPVLTGLHCRQNASDVFEFHRSTRRKSCTSIDSLESGFQNLETEMWKGIHSPNGQVISSANKKEVRTSCSVLSAGDAAAPRISKIPRALSQRCLRPPTSCPGLRPISVVSLK